ncbi:MAG: DUF4249 family protein [Bacteroidota bacterium]
MNRFKKRFNLLWVLLPVLSLLVPACSTEFEVYAPDQEIRAVYCILNPQDSAQYVRIARAFQVEGDAVVFAEENDLSLQSLNVRLTSVSDPDKSWVADQVDDFPKEEGEFNPRHTVYRFNTDGMGAGRDTLIPGERYRLEVGASDADDYVTGETTIPPRPRIRGDLQVVAGAGEFRCLPRIVLDRRYNFFWQKLDENINYEVRVYLKFAANGEEQTVVWGPTDLFNTNRRCNEGSGAVCYQFGEKELLRYWSIFMPVNPQVRYTYNTTDSCVANLSLLDNLPESLWFEVTAVDEYLSNYMRVNDPQFLDLSGTKPEYTNLRGNIEAVGVFGSVHADLRYAIMRECSEALLGLNGRVLPQGCEW